MKKTQNSIYETHQENIFLPRVSMIVWNEFRNDARVLKEAQTLQAAGYQVTVHALHRVGVTKERETLSCGIKVVRVIRSPFPLMKWRKKIKKINNSKPQIKITLSPKTKLTLKRRLKNFINRFYTHLNFIYHLVRSRPDIIHSHDVITLPAAWLASVLSKVPLVYDAHEISTDREGYAKFRKLVGWIEKKIMPRTCAAITTTDLRAKFFRLAYGVRRPVVLQNRPRLSQLPSNDRIRRYLDLKHPWPIVLYQGGLQPGRGLERIIETALQVPSTYFVFIGNGCLAADLRAQVVSLALQSRVYFIDTLSLDELPYFTASADIGIQAIENTCLNHFSTDSNKLFEYMMAGLAVVATNLPEMRKILTQYNFGLLIPSADTRALSEAIQQLVDNHSLRASLQANAKEARLTLNWEGQEEKLLDLYQHIFIKPSS